jgi:actin-related protein
MPSKAGEGKVRPIHPQSMGTRRDVIVLDNGGATIKVGFAGDDQPMW